MSKQTASRRSRKIKDMRILVANGVNLDLLGRRESQWYGTFTLADVEKELVRVAPALASLHGLSPVKLMFFQSNDEAQFLTKVSETFDGIVMNPGAWSHTSLALADRLVALATPFVEVHVSNLARREELRHTSLPAPHATGVVYGLGLHSYVAGLHGLLARLAASG